MVPIYGRKKMEQKKIYANSCTNTVYFHFSFNFFHRCVPQEMKKGCEKKQEKYLFSRELNYLDTQFRVTYLR